MLDVTRPEDIQGPTLNEISLLMFVCLHGHFRKDDRITPIVVRHAVCGFCMNLYEPNIKDAPLLTGEQSVEYGAYLQRHAAAAGQPDHRFVGTIYLTKDTTRAMIRQAYALGIRVVKYYPAGVTTNSDQGVSGWWESVWEALEEMALICEENPNAPMVFQIHAEEATEMDPWRREERAIEKVRWLAYKLNSLVISFEHASTSAAVELCVECPNVGLSVSVVHLLFTREDVVDHEGHLHADCWCAPVAKDARSRDRLIEAVTGRIPEIRERVYLGLDFAPHDVKLKDAQKWVYPFPDDKKPPMGAYSLDAAVSFLISIFERHAGREWIGRLQRFACLNGPLWYGLPLPTRRMTLRRKPATVPPSYDDPEGKPVLRSVFSGMTRDWEISESNIS